MFTSFLKLRLETPREVGIDKERAEDSGSNAPGAALDTAMSRGRLAYRYQDSRGVESEAEAVVYREGVKLQPGKEDLFPLSMFLHARVRSVHEDAAKFSELVRKKKKDTLVGPLRILEPRLADIVVLATSEGGLLSCDVGLEEMIPLGLVGEGMVRLASIVLATVSVPGGVVLVDEVENGLHHSVMEKVWRAIGEAARTQDVQVFATTHSFECIAAACEAFSETPDEFRLFRLEREDDRIRAVKLDTETATTALRHGMEVR